MNPFLKIGIGVGLVVAVVVGALALRNSIYAEGFRAGQNELKASIDARNKEVERLNKQLVTKDQDVIAAKEEDREKIVTIYRTIREQVEPQIVEKPVFRDCRVGAGVMRSLVAAAEGRVPTDPGEPAEAAGGKAAGTGR
ncbi:hypothetical protein [Cupriavidus sp. DL-D2]|uniref:hypothetical protein n=1 Tax=Cupriavidus sp. DL-D2 TaxID=3144974 RepID=UPI003215A8B8